jgi:ribosomal protein L7/L12
MGLRLWHPDRVEHWTHDGEVYEVNSMYLLPDDAWAYELTGPRGNSGRGPGLMVLIPDATPDDGPFTPMAAAHARVLVEDGHLPWPVLRRFVRLVVRSGDLVADAQDGAVTGDLALSCNSWRFADRAFEVNSYRFGEHDCWCYELYEVNSADTENNYVDVCIPDLQPVGGPFVPAGAERATFTAHGSLALPWPVFRHFLDAVEASGDVEGAPAMIGRHAESKRSAERVEEPLGAAECAVSEVGRGDAENLRTVARASNPAPPDFGSGDLELVLIAPGPTPIALIRKIREITGFGLMDGRALLEACPSVVVTGLSELRAAELRDALESAGAMADIRPR